MRRPSTAVRWGLPMVLFCVAGYYGLSRVRPAVQTRPRSVWRDHSNVHALHPRLQFMTGKIDAVDKRVRKRSERAVELELAHKAVMSKLDGGDDYVIRPIPRPADE